MANNKVTIDVEARFIDNLTPDVKKADRAIDNLGKKKPKVVIDADADQAAKDIDKTGKKLDDLDKKHPKPKVGLDDNASKGLDKLLDKTKRLADKMVSVAVKLRDDDALTQLSKIDEKARGLAGKTWTTVVKVKDMAMAPLHAIERRLFSLKTLAMGIIGGAAANKFVKQPLLDYANYEDLVTQFAVLLKGKSSKPNYEAAQARIDELTSFAGQTPFTRDEIYQASRVLQTYTQGALATPDSTGGLRMIGDIAAATGAEYSQVATYMGRLYNEVKRGGESMGEPLAFLREMGALSAEQEEKIKEIGQGSGTIEEKWKAIAGQFTNVNGMMLEMSNQTNNLLLGVKSFYTNNFHKKLGEGINESLKPFLIDFRKWRNDNGDLIAKWAGEIKDFAAEASDKVLTTVRKAASRAFKITQSEEFQSADMFGKIGMLWRGVVANPFADWWNSTVVPWWDSTAVPWISEKTEKLGKIMGSGLSNGLLALLGIDVTDATEEGASIAGGFVRGFLDGFDGTAVANAFLDAVDRVWQAMPLWAKMLVGGIGVSKAAGGILSVAGTIADLGQGWKAQNVGEYGGDLTGMAGNILGLRGFIGSTGNAMVGGSGLLGGLANIGYALKGGAAANAGLSGAAAAGIGAAGVAGGAVGAASLISGGLDLWRGYTNKNMNEETSNAFKGSGALKIGGVGAGAAAGAAIGSIIPGLGTAVGALVGAGVGGIGGWLIGGELKREAAESAKSLKDLEEQTADNSKASDVLAKRQEALAESLGDVKLSYAEVQEAASSIFSSKMTEGMKNYKTAVVNTNKAVQTLAGSTETLNKWNWKASIGFKFDDEGKEGYKKAVEDYISNAESVVENEHYEFTAAVSMLLDPKSKEGESIINGGDSFFGKLQKDLNSTSSKLTKQIDVALKDGKIDADESEIIEKLQNKIAKITQKVAQAETEAKMEALKIKFGAGAIDSESFKQLQEELQAQIESSTSTYDEALTASITNLKLQLSEGAIDQDEYDKQVSALTEGYKANIGEINAQAESLQLEILGDAYSNILGDDAKEDLSRAMSQSLADGIPPMQWTAEQAQQYLNAEGLTAEMATGIGTALQSVAEMAPPMDISALEITGEETIQENARNTADGAMSAAMANPFYETATMNLTVKTNTTFEGLPVGTSFKNLSAGTEGTWKKNFFRGGLVGMSIPMYGNGGQVQGGAQLAWLAEEGSPEMVIPLSNQRRQRGLQLWAKAGQMMGVPGFAEGGIAGGKDEKLRNHQSSAGGTVSQSTQINMGGVTVEVNVSGQESQNIVQAIAEQGQEIAEQVSGILAEALSAQFANTPTRG